MKDNKKKKALFTMLILAFFAVAIPQFMGSTKAVGTVVQNLTADYVEITKGQNPTTETYTILSNQTNLYDIKKDHYVKINWKDVTELSNGDIFKIKVTGPVLNETPVGAPWALNVTNVNSRGVQKDVKIGDISVVSNNIIITINNVSQFTTIDNFLAEVFIKTEYDPNEILGDAGRTRIIKTLAIEDTSGATPVNLRAIDLSIANMSPGLIGGFTDKAGNPIDIDRLAVAPNDKFYYSDTVTPKEGFEMIIDPSSPIDPAAVTENWYNKEFNGFVFMVNDYSIDVAKDSLNGTLIMPIMKKNGVETSIACDITRLVADGYSTEPYRPTLLDDDLPADRDTIRSQRGLWNYVPNAPITFDTEVEFRNVFFVNPDWTGNAFQGRTYTFNHSINASYIFNLIDSVYTSGMLTADENGVVPTTPTGTGTSTSTSTSTGTGTGTGTSTSTGTSTGTTTSTSRTTTSTQTGITPRSSTSTSRTSTTTRTLTVSFSNTATSTTATSSSTTATSTLTWPPNITATATPVWPSNTRQPTLAPTQWPTPIRTDSDGIGPISTTTGKTNPVTADGNALIKFSLLIIAAGTVAVITTGAKRKNNI